MRKKIIALLLLASLLFSLCSCSLFKDFIDVLKTETDDDNDNENQNDKKNNKDTDGDDGDDGENENESDNTLPSVDIIEIGTLINEYKKIEAKSADSVFSGYVKIRFGENEITLDEDSSSDGIEISATTLTIKKAGQYLIYGECENGQICVNCEEKADVTLLLNGLCLKNKNGAAIYCVSSPKKTVIESANGSVNLLFDSENSFSSVADSFGNTPNATVYSKDDLCFDGNGTLYVISTSGKAINCRDDLKIKGGELVVAAAGNAIIGKDSVTISKGKLKVSANGDGIKSNNSEDSEKGYIEISGGSFEIISGYDAIQAETTLTVSGGEFVINAGGGAKANTDSHSDDMGGGGFGGGGGGRGGFNPRGNTNTTTNDTSSDEESKKGIKAGKTLTISGGKFSIDANGDTIHTNSDLKVSGGSFSLSSGNKGMHADGYLTVSDGDIVISKSYEGIEGRYIEVKGGNIDITASDDGFNACDKTSASSSTTTSRGGFGGGGFGGTSSDCSLSFSGGYTVVNASGDGIDSNGNIYMSGGTLIVFGPTDNGNGPIDFGDSNNYFTINGGYLLAIGSSGMAESADGEDGTAVVAFRSGNLSQGTVLYITDSNGNGVLAFKTPKLIASCVFSSPLLCAGTSYMVYTGGSFEGETEDNVCFAPTSISGGSLLGTISAS